MVKPEAAAQLEGKLNCATLNDELDVTVFVTLCNIFRHKNVTKLVLIEFYSVNKEVLRNTEIFKLDILKRLENQRQHQTILVSIYNLLS